MDPIVRYPLDAPPLIHTVDSAGIDRPFLHPDRVLDFHVLLHVTVGEIRVFEAGVEHVVSAGDVLLLKAGLRHWGETPFAPGTRWRFVHFWLPGREEASMASGQGCRCDGEPEPPKVGPPSLSEPEPQAARIGPAPGSLWFREDYRKALLLPKKTAVHDRAAFEAKLAGIERVFGSHHPACGALASAQLACLLIELADLAAETGSADRADGHVRRLVALLESTPDRTLSASEIEAAMRMNYRYLCRIFKEGTGRTIRAHHLTFRMNEACRLMREEGLNVTETAVRLGFQDPLYFSHVFRRMKGQPPSAYLRNTRGSVRI